MAFINHSYKALFIHNPKCGGVYVRENLNNKYEFSVFANDTHHHYPDFFTDDSRINMQEDTDSHTIRHQGIYRYYFSHQDAKPAYFDTYKTFTFVRNPYEKLFSAYSYLKKMLYNNKEKKIRNTIENPEYFTDFNVFVQHRENLNNISYFHSFITQYDQLVDASGQIRVSYIGKCENLDNDFIEILAIIGCNEIKHVEVLYNDYKMNQSVNLNINIGKEYNEETFRFANEYFAKDFEVFGYHKFESYLEFVQYYTNKDSHISAVTKNVINICKEFEIYNYNFLLQQKLFKDYENIINCLFEGIQEHSKNPVVVCEINKFKTQINSVYDKKHELNRKNNMIYNKLHKSFLENVTKYVHSINAKCENCNHLLLSPYTFECHKRLCLPSNLTESGA